MKPKIAKIWVDALRSGKYKQGTGYLRTKNNEFCCLGVLCELAVKEGIIDTPVLMDDMDDNREYYIYENRSYGVLPNNVQEWAGMKNSNGRYTDTFDSNGNYVQILALYIHNDHDKMNFNQIADIIEQNVEKL